MPILRRFVWGALAILILSGAFAWGFATERFRIFPIGLMRHALVVLGFRTWSQPVELRSQSPALLALASVPYLNGAIDQNAKARNVLVNEGSSVAPGLNFFSTLGRGDAFLIDNDGKLRWRWSLDRYFSRGELRSGVDFGYTHLFPNGDVLAFVGERGLYKLDKNSRLLWKYAAQLHHDAWVSDDGTIYALAHETRLLPDINARFPSLLDTIEVLSPEGRIQRRISVFDIVQRSRYAFLLPKTAGLSLEPNTDSVDVLHTNHVETYDGSLAHLSSLFRRGNLLLSMKNINSVAIVDGETLDVLWLWGPTNLTLQHHPTILDNGDILLFDNGTSRSQVDEVDPRTNAVTWRYAPQRDFFSAVRGACQRLPNGDTLITLSLPGYALEVSPSARTVWSFANPSVTEGGFREGIYRMTRFPVTALPFLSESRQGS